MRSERELIAHYSVTELHQWIEEVFSGRAGYPSALDRLLASFSDSFSMVTMKGQPVGLSEVESLFRNNTGIRPDLRIETDACETLAQTETSVTLGEAVRAFTLTFLSDPRGLLRSAGKPDARKVLFAHYRRTTHHY